MSVIDAFVCSSLSYLVPMHSPVLLTGYRDIRDWMEASKVDEATVPKVDAPAGAEDPVPKNNAPKCDEVDAASTENHQDESDTKTGTDIYMSILAGAGVAQDKKSSIIGTCRKCGCQGMGNMQGRNHDYFMCSACRSQDVKISRLKTSNPELVKNLLLIPGFQWDEFKKAHGALEQHAIKNQMSLMVEYLLRHCDSY